MTQTASLQLPESLRQALDPREDVICALSPELRFLYCNPAWDRFALANQGELAMSGRVLGTNLLEVVGDLLGNFYRNMFAAVASSGKTFDFDYECSSADCFRLFTMHAMPLKEPGGFLVVHSLRVEEAHSREAESPDLEHYRDASGVVVMCSHCRRTRQAKEPQRWDWVPAYLKDRSLNVSHGLCNICLAYYYPEYTRTSTAKT